MREVASQGGGGSCGVLVPTDGDLRFRSIAQKAGWKPFAAQDKPALPVVAGITATTGNYNAATIFHTSPLTIGLMIYESGKRGRELPLSKSPSCFVRTCVLAGGGFSVCAVCGGGVVQPRHGVLHGWILQHTEAPSLEGAGAFHSR
jgi:hypothetical protein